VFGTHLPYEFTVPQVSFVAGCNVCWY